MNLKLCLSAILSTSLISMSLTSCMGATVTIPSAITTESVENIDTEFTNNDKLASYDESTAVKIDLNTLSVEGEGVSVNNNVVTIDSAGTYILSGEMSNGQIIVNVSETDKVHLVLNNAKIHNDTGAPIYIKESDKVFITLNKDTVNTLSDSENYIDTTVDSVLYSKADLSINGSGTLNITANYKDGIASKDDLIITDGNINVTAENIGLYGKDCVKISGGSFVLNTGADGIQSDNTETEKGYVYINGGSFEINSLTDGIQAERILKIDGGNFNIKTGEGSESQSAKKNSANEMPADMGGRPNNGNPPDIDPSNMSNDMKRGEFKNDTLPEKPEISTENTTSQNVTSAEDTSTSMKALKSGIEIVINNGTININSQGDAIHTNGNLTINNGSIEISAGDDGLHADSIILITNGTINISGSNEGIESNIIEIGGGDITVNASDDGINASNGESTPPNTETENNSTYIHITGGNTTVIAKGDGIDSNGSIYVEGGTLYVNGSENSGNSALDYDREAVITGGTVIATGSSGMAQGFSDTSTQNSILYNFESALTATDKVKITNSEGINIIEYTPSAKYQSVVISCPELKTNENYTISAGDQSENISLTSSVYSNGRTGGMRGNGEFRKDPIAGEKKSSFNS